MATLNHHLVMYERVFTYGIAAVTDHGQYLEKTCGIGHPDGVRQTLINMNCDS